MAREWMHWWERLSHMQMVVSRDADSTKSPTLARHVTAPGRGEGGIPRRGTIGPRPHRPILCPLPILEGLECV